MAHKGKRRKLGVHFRFCLGFWVGFLLLGLSFFLLTGIPTLFLWYSAPLVYQISTAYFKNKHNLPCLHLHFSSMLTKTFSDP